MARKLSKRKRPRREDKIVKIEWPLEEGVFDRESLLTLEKFMRKNIFRTLDYCIARGKEANIYRGTTAEGGYVAIKMFRLRSPSFLHMQKYIEGDRRFQKASKSKFGIIFTWARKEYSNLKLMEQAGIRAPKSIAFKHNVLAMEFLGENGIPYSTLADTGSENPNKDYQLILSDIEKMRKKGLVHSDLSEYNILMTDSGPYLIDCGQAVLTSHPNAEEFYMRDLANLKKYFSKYKEFKG
ncbi:MAG: serine protein kinase RIO [Candidatus Micrarchaeota archaeon]